MMTGITKQLKLERISRGHLVELPLLKQGQGIHSARVSCKLNNPITYGKLTMKILVGQNSCFFKCRHVFSKASTHMHANAFCIYVYNSNIYLIPMSFLAASLKVYPIAGDSLVILYCFCWP